MEKKKNEKEKLNKEDMMDIKDMDETDWRGVLALVILIGGFILLSFLYIIDKIEGAAGVLVLMYAVTDWYFKSKKKGEE